MRPTVLLLIASIGLASFVPAGPAAAQAADKATLIRRLLSLTNVAALAVTTMETSIPAQRAANPRIPKELRIGADVGQDLAKRGVKMPSQ